MKHIDVQKLYTARTSLYHAFIAIIGYTAAINKVFEKREYIKPSMRILDAGCGGGLLTKALYNLCSQKNIHGITFHGFDLTPAMLNHFRTWIEHTKATNIQLAQADVLKPEQLPTDWNNYDLIVTSGMLEHIPKDHIVQAISNLKKLLAPGGTMLIFICRSHWLTKPVIEWWWKAETYSKQEVTHIVHEAGFTNLCFREFPAPFKYFDQWMHIIEASG